MGKETVLKKRPPYIVCEKQEGERHLKKRIGFVKVVPKLRMNKVLKQIPVPLYTLFHK